MVSMNSGGTLEQASRPASVVFGFFHRAVTKIPDGSGTGVEIGPGGRRGRGDGRGGGRRDGRRRLGAAEGDREGSGKDETDAERGRGLTHGGWLYGASLPASPTKQ